MSRRIADTLLVKTLRWGLESLAEVRNDARSVEPTIDEEVADALDVALDMLAIEPIASATGAIPSRVDVEAIKGEGRPWNAVAPVCDELRHLNEASVSDLANHLIMPAENLRWRLFHLAVLGEMLVALRDYGCVVHSIRPLSGTSNGPSYLVTDAQGRTWDLWFEGAGVWSWYGRRSPYARITSGIEKAGRPLGADIALILPRERALILECKYSYDYGVVCRDGYAQAVAYAAEFCAELVLRVAAAVVGPEGVVPLRPDAEAYTNLTIGPVGIVSPPSLAALVASVIQGGTT